MPELDGQHRAQLAEALRAATRDTCDEVECDPEFTADYCLRALAPLVAEWLADAWDTGYTSGQHTDKAAMTQARNPYRGGDS